MIKLLTIIGARPQIIKAAAVSRAVKTQFSDRLSEDLLHTGQHYDEQMSDVFFKELGIPHPVYNLGVGSAPHGAQTAQMVCGIEAILAQTRYDGILVYGDTNSTMASAIAAAKMQIPVFHVEAGLRSYNMAMPEEQNRIVCDHLSNICFAPTISAKQNLLLEGIGKKPTTFANGRKQLVLVSGDVMLDNCLHFSNIAETQSTIREHLGLLSKPYLLVTIHRDFNTDNPLRLASLLNTINTLAESNKICTIIPLHPRTAKAIKMLPTHDGLTSPWVKTISPASYLDMVALERHAQMIITDSGGVQKEAFFFERPCIILRPETEWTEITDCGAGILVSDNQERLLSAYHTLSSTKLTFPPLFGDGHAAENIIHEIINYL